MKINNLYKFKVMLMSSVDNLVHINGAVAKRLFIKDIYMKYVLFYINHAKGTVYNEFLFIVQQSH